VPPLHPPGSGQRTYANEHCRAGGAQAQDSLARRHHASGHVAAGIHAEAGSAGARPHLHLVRFHDVLAPNAKLRALVVPQVPEPPAQTTQPAACETNCAHHRPVRLSWAKLLNRVFEIELEHCPNCDGELKIIAAILERPVIGKILTHLELQARAPSRAAARGQALQAA
jgi:hypothetical protein